MRAIGFQSSHPIHHTEALLDIDLPDPVPTGRDLLVEIRAISVNPIDIKVRASAKPENGQWRVLGWDAAGVVKAVGADVRDFAVGDEVFYAGALQRPGTNAELHLVDERIVGRKPKTLDWAQAAALPLTALTAWEMLFDRLDIRRLVPGTQPSLLIIGGAGGVGSIAIQLARVLTNVTVIATASRPETQAWVRELGAHHVIDHREALAPQVAQLPTGAPGFVFATTETAKHFKNIVELLAPQGHLGLIDDPAELDAMPLKRKSLSLHWELMFTRSMYETADIDHQGKILNEISSLIDSGRIRTTLGEHFGSINATNLRRAHALIESGRARGKLVLEGFGATGDAV
nr:zinc-binding alcohol dehydrogenase family protein [uncultured Neokomagataea sp.]